MEPLRTAWNYLERLGTTCYTKYSQHNPSEWPKYLALALWADRITVRKSTGCSAFELLYGRDCLLLVELSVRSWVAVDWGKINSREDLILAKMQQLDARQQSEELAAENLRRSHLSNKEYFDQHKRLRLELQKLNTGDLVLLYDDSLRKSKSRFTKLNDRWRGLYRIRETPEDSTYYRLEELDGTSLAQSFAGNRLRKFFVRQ